MEDRDTVAASNHHGNNSTSYFPVIVLYFKAWFYAKCGWQLYRIVCSTDKNFNHYSLQYLTFSYRFERRQKYMSEIKLVYIVGKKRTV